MFIISGLQTLYKYVRDRLDANMPIAQDVRVPHLFSYLEEMMSG